MQARIQGKDTTFVAPKNFVFRNRLCQTFFCVVKINRSISTDQLKLLLVLHLLPIKQVVFL